MSRPAAVKYNAVREIHLSDNYITYKGLRRILIASFGSACYPLIEESDTPPKPGQVPDCELTPLWLRINKQWS